MISTHDDIPFTIIPQSNTRCSVISAITLSEDDFVGSRRHSSRLDYDESDDDDEDDIEQIEASIEQMVMDMHQRKSQISAVSAVSESTESDASYDRFGSITGPRTSELLQAIHKPERKPSMNIRLSSITGSHGHYLHHRDSHLEDDAHHDRMPNLPSRRPSKSISRMQSHVSDQTDKSTLV